VKFSTLAFRDDEFDHRVLHVEPFRSLTVRTLPLVRRTPSARRRLACSRSWPGTNRPDVVITLHHGNPGVVRRRLPTARAAPGYPASAAISPYVVTTPRGIDSMIAVTDAVNAPSLSVTACRRADRPCRRVRARCRSWR
jgi:hypothetical protein